MANDKTKLLPCPFCGSSAELYNNLDDKNCLGFHLFYWVSCNGRDLEGEYCLAEAGRYSSKKKAIENWNRRTDSASIKKLTGLSNSLDKLIDKHKNQIDDLIAKWLPEEC